MYISSMDLLHMIMPQSGDALMRGARCGSGRATSRTRLKGVHQGGILCLACEQGIALMSDNVRSAVGSTPCRVQICRPGDTPLQRSIQITEHSCNYVCKTSHHIFPCESVTGIPVVPPHSIDTWPGRSFRPNAAVT